VPCVANAMLKRLRMLPMMPMQMQMEQHQRFAGQSLVRKTATHQCPWRRQRNGVRAFDFNRYASACLACLLPESAVSAMPDL